MKGYGSSHAFTAQITFIFWFQTKALLLVVTFKTLHMQAFKAKLQISKANPPAHRFFPNQLRYFCEPEKKRESNWECLPLQTKGIL